MQTKAKTLVYHPACPLFRDATGNVMCVYKLHGDTLRATERYLYGSKRLGVLEQQIWITANSIGLQDSNTIGVRVYEFTDHLGNVTYTAQDRKHLVQDSYGQWQYIPSAVSYTDYYPFGYPMPGRSTDNGGYRYFFNGQEADNEVLGEGGLHAFEYRMHDTRIGRFWSVDPLAGKFPWNSTYAFAENDVIRAIDLEGLEKWITQTSQLSYGPYSLEYVTSNNYRPLQDVIQSDQLIDAVEQAQTSQTFTSLQTKANLVEFTVTNDKSGTWIIAKDKKINIDYQANTSGMIQGMAWEMTNASNAQRLIQIESMASKGEISKEEYVMGKIRIESEALVNQVLIATELGLHSPLVDEYIEDIKSLQAGETERTDLLDKISRNGYLNTTTKLQDGTIIKISEAYSKQYDSLLQKKNNGNL